MRYLSVCSGMEAASVAWHQLGWQPVGFSEIEPFPCAILKQRFPNIPNHGSLTEHHTWPIEPGAIDLLVGGTPCQSFSVAGLRKGLADPRGNLALTFLALADRLKPKWIVWENVPGVLSSGGGRDFGSFLGALVELGYGFAYRVLDAQYVGGPRAVPQRRRRVFVVACLGDWRAPAEVLSLREGLRGYLEAGGKKRKGVAADAGASASTGCWWDGGQVSQTLDAVLQKGQTMPEKNRFPAVLQPKPVVIDRAAFNQGVNAQFDPHIAESEVMDSLVARGPHAVGHPIPFRKSKRAASTTDNETWVPADVTNTLNNFDLGDTRTTHAVVNSVAPTVTSSGPPYSRTGNERVEAEALAITFQPGNLRREAGAEPSTTTTTTLKASAGDQTPHVAYPAAGFKWHQGSQAGSIGYQEGIAPTVTTDKSPGVIHPVVPLDGMNLLSRLGECGEEHSMQNFQPGEPSFTLKKGGNQHGVLTPMAVRRLTPVECERLQGFPDNWSRIPWKGKPEEECPDGPRYKACGNSMAVPVMRWIGERIAAVEASSHA